MIMWQDDAGCRVGTNIKPAEGAVAVEHFNAFIWHKHVVKQRDLIQTGM